MQRLLPLALVALACVLFAAGCRDGETAAKPAATESSRESGPAVCSDVEAPAARGDGTGSAPTDALDAAVTYSLVFATSCGTFTITLDVAGAPATSASLVALAREGFFDNTAFHRIVPGFVIQGGDPTGSGSGGPGYSTVDAPPADAGYVEGVVAMAKTMDELPGTSGSQFFVVTGADVGLPAEYAIVGTVTDGVDVVHAIEAQGDPATEQPLKPVVVTTVTVAESP